MGIDRCRYCDVPITLMQFPTGERLFHHTPIIGYADEVGELFDIRGAYFYCSSGRKP
jgi:hypothetical protein